MSLEKKSQKGSFKNPISQQCVPRGKNIYATWKYLDSEFKLEFRKH